MALRRESSPGFLGVLLLAWTVSGCAPTHLGTAPALTQTEGDGGKAVEAVLGSQWPPGRMTHRVVLTAGGMEFAFDGHMALSESGAIRLVAMGFMGQIVFDLLVSPDGSFRHYRLAPVFPEEWLGAFVCPDLRLAFQSVERGALRSGTGEGRAVCWRKDGPGGDEYRYWIDTGRLSGIDQVREDRVIKRLTLADAAGFPPSRFHIKSPVHELDVRILKVKPGEPPSKLFREAGP